jgi:hypothetical protein
MKHKWKIEFELTDEFTFGSDLPLTEGEVQQQVESMDLLAGLSIDRLSITQIPLPLEQSLQPCDQLPLTASQTPKPLTKEHIKDAKRSNQT